MTINTRPSPNFKNQALAFIRRAEGDRPEVYGDPVGIPTVGYGYALVVQNAQGIWVLKDTLVEDFGAIGIVLTADQLRRLREIAAEKNSGRITRAKTLSNELGDQVGLGDISALSPSGSLGLLERDLERATDAVKAQFRRFLGNSAGDLLFSSLSGSVEMVALASLAYNAPSTIGRGLTRAISNGDRAEAWFEIRYNTNPESQNAAIRGGLANRRYRESGLFGLSDEGEIDEIGAKGIYRMFTRHRGQILAYEAAFDPTNPDALFDPTRPNASNSLENQFAEASALLLAAEYTQGIEIAWDHIYIGENDGSDGGTDSRYYLGGRATADIDINLLGSDGNDLIMAESGSDRISGAAGRDVIYGGAGADMISGGAGDDHLQGGSGDDTYYSTTGDGHDEIRDSTGSNLLVFEGALATGIFVREPNEEVYRTPSGRFTATLQDGSLLITDSQSGGSILLPNFVSGQFGLQLQELTALPDPETLALISDISTTGGVTTYTGTEFAETTAGSSGDDDIRGNGGGDYLRGGLGADRIEAGPDALSSTLDGGLGRDVIQGSAGSDRISGGLAIESGTNDDDAIQGGTGEDYIEGGWGDDFISGGGGRDILLGGAGADTIEGSGNRTAQNRQWSVVRTIAHPNPNSTTVTTAFNNFIGDVYAADSSGDIAYGGSGADNISGAAGNDIFFGEGDADFLFGNAGDDSLDGGSGEDVLDGDTGSDRLFGGSDGDQLWGGANDDFLDGGTGDDVVRGNEDNDTLVGGTGNDILYGGWGTDVLHGDDGDDSLAGGNGGAEDNTDSADLLVGGAGNDLLQGDGGDDTLRGGIGNDSLIGGAGADILDGGAGNDVIYRDAADTIIFGTGDGSDSISMGDGPGGSIIFRDWSIDQISISSAVDTATGWQYLVLYKGTDQISMQGGFLQWNMTYELNGEQYAQRELMARASAMSLTGTAQADTIYGSNAGDIIRGYLGTVAAPDGADLIIGQGGNDQLEGGNGDDSYSFALGDGRDRVVDTQGINHVVFQEGVQISDVYLDFSVDGSNSRILRYSSADQITFAATSYAAGVTIALANGDLLAYQEQTGTSAADTLTGSAGADVLNGAGGIDSLSGGAGNDTLIGGSGADMLAGGTESDLLSGGDGNDSYRFNSGDGRDIIREYGSTASEYNTITFGVGISLSNLTFHAYNNDLVIGVLGSNDQLVLDEWFGNSNRIDNLIFANFSQYSISDRSNLVTANVGSEGDDTLYGDTSGIISIIGNDGNDTLHGTSRGGVMDGGQGNDTTNGGSGDDIYLFRPGDGQDRIFDTGGKDQLVLERINRTDVIFGRSANDLIIEVAESTDKVTIRNWWYTQGGEQIEAIVFADGTRMTATEINQHGQVLIGTSADDVLYSGQSADEAQGLDGNDTINLGPGDDTIDGNGGNDNLSGSYGNDILRGGAGNDELYGGQDDDLLEGGEGGDQLVGGLGSDVMDGGAGADALYGNSDSGSDGHLDTFRFGRGSGSDMIYAHAEDRLLFLAGVTADDLVFSRSGYDLVVNIAGTSDRATLARWFNVSSGALQDFVFADATTLPTESIYQSFLVYSGTLSDDIAMYGNHESEIIRGLDGNDALHGYEGDDRLEGGLGNDRLYGHAGADQLYGEEGDDQLVGRADDLLDGGSGNDSLEGGGGSTYIFGGGYGQDTILNYGAAGYLDRVVLTAGIAADDLTFVRTGNDLRLTVVATDDTLTIRNWFSSESRRIGRFELHDGTLLRSPTEITDSLLTGISAEGEAVLGTAGADVLTGSSAVETLYGLTGDDILIGGDGDLLVGGGGNDDYQFGRGDGVVAIYDYDQQDVQSGTGSDRVIFAADISASDLSLRRVDNDLVLAITASSDQLTVRNWFAGASYQVEFVFADASSLPAAAQIYSSLLSQVGTNLDDVIQGYEGNDTLSGLDGDDWILGGVGNDVLDGGAGWDVLEGESGNDTLYGDGDDVLLGSHGDDILYGGGGGALEGGDGNDLLDAGARSVPSSDWVELKGELGSDTYVFGRDYGIQRIRESHNAGDRDEVRFAVDLSANDVTFARWASGVSAGSLSVTINGTSDILYVENHTNLVFVFADGTRIDAIDIENAVLTTVGDESSNYIQAAAGSDILYGLNGADELRGGDGNDVLYGGEGDDLLIGDSDSAGTLILETHGDDLLQGGGGDDVLRGGAGDDILDGGSGTDMLTGGAGNDRYIYAVGSGRDVINDYDQFDANPYVFGTTVDRVTFGSGIRIDRMLVTLDGSDLNIRIGEDDQIKIQNWSLGSIEEFEFSDGSVLTSAQMAARIGAAIDNVAPTLEIPLADQAVPEGSSFTYQPPQGSFIDADAGEILRYSAIQVGGTALPAWLILDPVTGVFSGLAQAPGVLTIRMTAKDSLGEMVSDEFTVTVSNVNDAPALIEPLYDQTVRDSNPLMYQVSSSAFFDEDVGDVLAYEATLQNGGALPEWLSFDGITRVFSGTPGMAEVGILQVRVVARDGSGAEASDIFDLHVQDAGVYGTEFDDASIFGSNENDRLYGLSGNDVLESYSGNDLLDGGSGIDTMRGGQGNDTYIVDSASDVVVESSNQGVDTILSQVGLTLGSNVENLTLTGSSGINGTGNSMANVLTGNGANNTLSGGTGADVLIGGAGDDIYVVDNSGDVIVEGQSEGVDLVQSSVAHTLGTNVENLTLTGSSGVSGTGNGLDNVLSGNSGNNTLMGGAGNDTLNGGSGTDAMLGGSGDDTYVVAQTGDVITEAVGEGTDVVQASVSYTLAGNVENLTLTGTAAVGTGNGLDNILIGNASANTLTGNGGNDVLNGAGGSDSMSGGAGDDTYFVDVTGDVTTESAGNGIDTVQSAVTRTLAANIEALFLTGSGNNGGTGNAAANLLRGNSGGNVLNGAGGVDILEGGEGVDMLSNSTSPGNTLLNGGAGADELTGTSVKDMLIGGIGNDSIATNSGADIIVFNMGDGLDTVAVSTVRDNVVSIGGGGTYADLLFQKSANDLILKVGANDQITFSGYYASAGNRSVDRLQIIIEGTTDYIAGSADVTRNKKIETFNFEGLFSAFEAARAIDPSITAWGLAGSLAAHHLDASDVAAIGGDLAYRYGRFGTLSDISFTPGLSILGAAGFAATAQSLSSLGGLQDSSSRLS